MKTIPLSQLLNTAILAAKTAGQHALANKNRREEYSETFAHDVKLILDRECQDCIEKVILDAFPQHSILGEEGTYSSPTDEYEWVIDPIDGTMNYTRGFPYWCVSVAVRRNGTVLAGCVFDPETDNLYTAHLEEPAQCNGKLIHPSTVHHLADATLFSGITKYVNLDPEPHFNLFQKLILNTKKVRINGAAALDICHVAAGHADGFIETNLYLWDHAAAGLIAQQAGAIISVQPLPTEPHACEVICTNPHLIDALQALHPTPSKHQKEKRRKS